MPTMKWKAGDFVAVSLVRFSRNIATLGISTPKKLASEYLHSSFPDARIRRVLGAEDDASLLVLQPLLADVRQTLNEVVLTIDAMPHLFSSRTELGRVAFAEPGGDDDGLLNFLHIEGPADTGLTSLAEATEGKLHVLDVIDLIGPRASQIVTVRTDEAAIYHSLSTQIAARLKEGAFLRAVYY